MQLATSCKLHGRDRESFTFCLQLGSKTRASLFSSFAGALAIFFREHSTVRNQKWRADSLLRFGAQLVIDPSLQDPLVNLGTHRLCFARTVPLTNESFLTPAARWFT